MDRFLLVSLALCLCIAEVAAQCRWEFDMGITAQVNLIYPAPKRPACDLFVSDTVTFNNLGSEAYYVVRLNTSDGFDTCNMNEGTIIESNPFPLVIPATGGQLSFTLSRATSGFWDFFVGDEIYFISNGTDKCLTAAFTVQADLNRNCAPLSFNGECMAPPTTTTVSTTAGITTTPTTTTSTTTTSTTTTSTRSTTTTSTRSTTSTSTATATADTSETTSTPPNKPPLLSPWRLPVNIALSVLIAFVAVLLIIGLFVLAALIVHCLVKFCAKKRRKHEFMQMSDMSQ